MSKFDFKGNKVLRYSGLATQIFISLCLAAWAGRYLDQKMEMEKPLWTAFLSILMLVMNFIWLYFDVKKLDQ